MLRLSKKFIVTDCRLLLLMIALLTGSILHADVIKSNELAGAELYADNHGHGKVTVWLNVWYSCSAGQAPATEHVSVFYPEGSQLLRTVALQLDTLIVRNGKRSAPCCNGPENCVSMARYKGEVDLGDNRANYLITWATCCTDPSFTTLEPGLREALALVLELKNPANSVAYRTSYLDDLPAHHACSNTTTTYYTEYVNSDSLNVSVTLTDIQSQRHVKYPYTSQVKTLPGSESVGDYMYSGNILTTHPPLTPVSYRKGFDGNTPAGSGNFSVTTNGKLTLKANTAGKHPVQLRITNSKNGQITSTHPAFLIINIH
jgi:hypothetical protein